LIVYPAGDPTPGDSQNVSYPAGASSVAIEGTVGAKDEITFHNAGSVSATVTVSDIGYSTQITATNIAHDGGSSGQVLTNNGSRTAWQAGSLSVNTGTGLLGGGSIQLGSGRTLSVDPATVQRRVRGSCSTGEWIASINEDGTVQCATLPYVYVTRQFNVASGTSMVADVKCPSYAIPVGGGANLGSSYQGTGDSRYAYVAESNLDDAHTGWASTLVVTAAQSATTFTATAICAG
jgi:hypothetical protein